MLAKKTILLCVRNELLRLGYKAFLEMRGFFVDILPVRARYQIIIVHGGKIPECVQFDYKIVVGDLKKITDAEYNAIYLQEFITSDQLEIAINCIETYKNHK